MEDRNASPILLWTSVVLLILGLAGAVSFIALNWREGSIGPVGPTGSAGGGGGGGGGGDRGCSADPSCVYVHRGIAADMWIRANGVLDFTVQIDSSVSTYYSQGTFTAPSNGIYVVAAKIYLGPYDSYDSVQFAVVQASKDSGSAIVQAVSRQPSHSGIVAPHSLYVTLLAKQGDQVQIYSYVGYTGGESYQIQAKNTELIIFNLTSPTFPS